MFTIDLQTLYNTRLYDNNGPISIWDQIDRAKVWNGFGASRTHTL